MLRTQFTFAVFFALSAWAGAQGPPPRLSAADQLRMLRANRAVLANLVNDSISLAAAETAVDRAESSRRTARTLSLALRDAVDDRDSSHVLELGRLYELFVRDGLLPNIGEADRDISNAAQVKRIREDSLKDLDAVQTTIPTTGKIGSNEQVKAARRSIEGLRVQFQ